MFRKMIKKIFKLYDLKDLQGWGHCGCCGSPINNEVFVIRDGGIRVCDKCLEVTYGPSRKLSKSKNEV